jgi:hypothetical protein
MHNTYRKTSGLEKTEEESIAIAIQTQRVYHACGQSIARGFARVILDRKRESLDPAIDSRNQESELGTDVEFSSSTRPLSAPLSLAPAEVVEKTKGLQLRHNQAYVLLLTVLLLFEKGTSMIGD